MTLRDTVTLRSNLLFSLIILKHGQNTAGVPQTRWYVKTMTLLRLAPWKRNASQMSLVTAPCQLD